MLFYFRFVIFYIQNFITLINNIQKQLSMFLCFAQNLSFCSVQNFTDLFNIKVWENQKLQLWYIFSWPLQNLINFFIFQIFIFHNYFDFACIFWRVGLKHVVFHFWHVNWKWNWVLKFDQSHDLAFIIEIQRLTDLFTKNYWWLRNFIFWYILLLKFKLTVLT